MHHRPDTHTALCTPTPYTVVDANMMFGPNSLIMMPYFTVDILGPGYFFTKACGLIVLHLCLAPFVFGIDTTQLAKLWLSLNVTQTLLFVWVVTTFPEATYFWWLQIGMQGVIVVANAIAVKGAPKGSAMF